MEFKDRLKQLRQESSLNQTDFGKKFNVIKQTVSSWEQGNSKPDLDILMSIANFFNVTTDYLLGYSSNPNVPQSTVSQEDLELLQKIKNLPADRREIVDTVIKVSDTTVIKKAASEK